MLDEIFLNKMWGRIDELECVIRGMQIIQNHEGCSSELWESMEYQIEDKKSELVDLNSKYC